VDTVTNFTTLVADFKRRDIHHIYLITSEFHMPRAKAIAYFVLGSRGIAFTSVTVPSKKPPESWLHVLRDSSRAVVWIITGRTGASLNPNRAAQTKNQNPKSTLTAKVDRPSRSLTKLTQKNPRGANRLGWNC
jgi:hypothetical protein